MTQKLYKNISFLLIICILISILPYQTQAIDIIPGELTKIKQLRDSEGFNKGSMIVTDGEVAELAYIVRNNVGNTPVVNERIDYLNVGVYKYYNIVAYGKRHNKTGESCDIFGEYRYLGHDIQGSDITNDRFLNDFPPDTTKLEEMDWRTVNGAIESWTSKGSDIKIQERIMTYGPIKDDGKSINYSISSILRNKISAGSSNDDERKKYIYINTIPTLASSGSVKLERLVNGSRRYNTFTIPKFPFDPTVTVTTDIASYTIAAAESTVTAKVTVTANLEIDTELGRTPAEALKNVYVTFEGQNKLAPIVNNKASAIFDKVFKRGESGFTESDTMGNTVKLEGYIYSMESIFDDTWGTKYGKAIRGETNKLVFVKPSANAYVDITATPVPDSVRFSDADIPVKVNVSAELIGYSNLANIQNVVLYAKFADDPFNIFKSKTFAATTTTFTFFDFIIPKSKVTSDSFDQQFNVTAVFTYKTSVNGLTNATGSTSCITNIYKEEPIPPIPGNIPPKAKIIAPATIKAGDEFLVDGSSSSDVDGYIVDYQWTLPGTDIELYDESGDIWYPEEGKYTIKLRIADDGGAHDSTTKSIVVLPPTPDANIKILGAIKENRKITLDATGSTSPTHYPMVWTNTTWGISVVSGNTSSDIKYNGVLNGNKTKDILVKKAGSDRVQLSVFNTKSLSDTESLNINIAQDKPPIADFSAVTSIFRNPEDTNYSLITVNDTSYSTDNDFIKNSVLTFSYDSDNNGVFNNGSIQIDAADYADGQTKTVTTNWGFDVPITVFKPIDKPIRFDIRTKHVGKYYIDLKAIEGFGQETIPEFITDADYRYDDTMDKPNIEKTIEVLNFAPVAGFNMTNKRKADIVIALPDNISKATAESQINSKVIPGLVNSNMDYNIRYVNYQTYKPLPVDNSYFFITADKEVNEQVIHYFNYSTGMHYEEKMTHLVNRYAELFITDQNYAYTVTQSSYYAGDGVSKGYYVLRRIFGNDTLDTTVLYSTRSDVEARHSGEFLNLTVNKAGTLFWTYRNVRYMRTLTGTANVVVPAGTEDGLPYGAWSEIAPNGTTYSLVSATLNGKFALSVVSTKGGVSQVLHTEKISKDDDGDTAEWIVRGRFYPPDDLNTIDEAFSSITWADNHEKYFVTLSTTAISELSNSSNVNNIVTKSITDGVTLINMGNATNKSQFDSLIEKNDGNGLYTDIVNLDTAFTKLGDYILKRLKLDLVFNIGQTGYALGTIQSKVNSVLKPKLAAGNVSACISYIISAVDMNNALGSAVWNPLNDHMLIHVQDTLISELNDGTKRSALLNELKANEADVVGLGRAANSSQLNSLISSNDSEGTYLDNTNLDVAMNSLGDYVVTNARRKSPNVYKYVILGEEVEYSTTYKDIESDPVFSERWKFSHSETYFENNLGRISDSGVYRTTPYTLFNKTGKYEITYGARDNPKDINLFDNYRLWSNEELSKATILVHRRPIASYLWSVVYNTATAKYSMVTTDTSEDLDHLSRADKGIVQREWKWKLPTDTSWKMGVPTEIQKENTYLLQLIVQDIEGAWSETYTQEIEVPSLVVDAVPPFRDWANTDVNVNVITTRTGPSSLLRVDYKWTNDRNIPAGGWLTNSTYSFNTVQTLNGEWFLHMIGYDNYGASYYLYKGPYRIDKIAPAITADKTTAESSEPITVNVEVADAGGSGIKKIKYAWSLESSKPNTWEVAASDNFSTIQDNEGLWYLHVEATDNAGNVTYVYLGTYKVDSFKLEKFRVVMVRDLQLDDYYFNRLTNKYDDIPMHVNRMAIDNLCFGGVVDGLTKGYKFEFEIDSRNFNENTDSIVIVPHFYTTDTFARDNAEREMYWEDSNHQVYRAGEGGHDEWGIITLTTLNRTIKANKEATWRGEYLIPGTAWAVPKDTLRAQAKAKDLKRDIIVSFNIKGYKNGMLQFDYNEEQWDKERTVDKYPYIIGDVIRYSWDKNCLDDINAKDNR